MHWRGQRSFAVENSWLLQSCFVSLIAVLFTVLAETKALAEALVGETRTYDALSRPETGTEALKQTYKRPGLIPFPADNPYTPKKAALGKKLYFDPRLSSSGTQSCASCHSPAFGWGDGLSIAVGDKMEKLARRSPTIVNAAWGSIFMWDGRVPDLEEQALGPIMSASEMNMPIDALLVRLSSIPGYRSLFAEAFPEYGVSVQAIKQALATYQRTIVSGWAPFDAWIEGDEMAIPEEAKRGFVVFNTKAKCSSCHAGWNFTDDSFHDIGLPSPDMGRGKFLPTIVKMQHAFKTPGLREITSRAPYMHDGSIDTLSKVVEHYDDGGINRESRSDLIGPLGLTEAEKSDLVAFLKSLSGEETTAIVPELPR
ncbi:MAG: c-type cytochrome [Hyphomicrobiales bacterium]|nr:c-type cytochrome [Hyphomicrobiales bacterium]